MTRRLPSGLVAVALLASALAGCGYGSRKEQVAGPRVQVAATGKKLSADTVTIGYFANVTHATAMVGYQEGLYAKELGGTQLRTQVFNAGPAAIEALNAGAVDIAWMGPSPAVNGFVRSDGRSLRVIAGAASGGVSLVVNPDRIRSTADVKGKRIATPQLGNTQDVAFLNWIDEQGWDVDSASGEGDVTVLRQDNKEIPTSFRQGGIDGAWVPEPVASKLVAEGGKVLVDERTLWPDGQFVNTNMVVSQTFLKDHPDVVEAILRGSVKTSAWIAEHPEQAKDDVNRSIEQASGQPLPDDVLDMAWENVEITDDPLAKTLAIQADHAVATELLEETDLTGIYDLGPLNRVLAEEGRPAVDDAGLGVSTRPRK